MNFNRINPWITDVKTIKRQTSTIRSAVWLQAKIRKHGLKRPKPKLYARSVCEQCRLDYICGKCGAIQMYRTLPLSFNRYLNIHQLRTIVCVADRWRRLCRGTTQGSCRRCYHAICEATAECRSLPDISSETNWSLHDRSSAVSWQVKAKRQLLQKQALTKLSLERLRKRSYNSFHHVRMNRFLVIYSSKMQQQKPDSKSVALTLTLTLNFCYNGRSNMGKWH